MTTKRILAGICFTFLNKEAAVMRHQMSYANKDEEDEPDFQKAKATLLMIESFCDELADEMKGHDNE